MSTTDCQVPGCQDPAAKDKEDVCKRHGLVRRYQGAPMTLKNDGVIDWTAIELAVEGSRPVRLTWIEREIAAATMLAKGFDRQDVYNRLNVNLFKTAERKERIYAMADVIKREGRHVSQ